MSEDSANIALTVNGGTVQTAIATATTGNWTIAVPALNENESVSVTAQVYGEDVSIPAIETVKAVPVQTATPTITTPIYAADTSVSGTSAANATISLSVNGGTVHIAIAYPNGNWIAAGMTLAEDDAISVTATGPGNTVSQSATATVEATPAPVFSDVSTTYWGYNAITVLSGKGIVSGYPDGTFKPGATVTRAEFTAMLVKALSLSTANTTGQFTDVTPDDWCYGSVNAAVHEGLVSGMGDNLFAPNALVTREQMAVMVASALGTSALGTSVPGTNFPELDAYSDGSSASSWAVPGMAEAIKEGIVSGLTTSMLAPRNTATRAQAAAMIYRLLAVSGR
jgi:hypothetical protein